MFNCFIREYILNVFYYYLSKLFTQQAFVSYLFNVLLIISFGSGPKSMLMVVRMKRRDFPKTKV